jgi:hypothetical protein
VTLEWKGRRRLALLALLAALVLLLVALTRRDTTPPTVTAVVPAKVPASLPFTISWETNERSSITLSYAGQRETVKKGDRATLQAVAGPQILELAATDIAGNASLYQYQIYGIPEVQPTVKAADRTRPGEPVSIRISWPDGSQVTSVLVSRNGDALPIIRQSDEAIALDAVPLGSSAAKDTYTIALTDSYGRMVTLRHTLEVLSDSQQVQELDLSTHLASLRTPRNEALEADALHKLLAASQDRDAPLWTKPFIMPISGTGTSGYGVPRRYVTGGEVVYHTGMDIAAPKGTPIAAANDGVVIVARHYPIQGNLTVIDHGAGVFSLYFHQSKILVKVGESVKRGQVIGLVGATGLATGPHLHWEMHINGVPTDPKAWVGKVWP